MKQLIATAWMIFFVVGFTNLHAQTTKTCTPEQIAACKKICGTAAATKQCTPEQIAACKKTCTKTAGASATATTTKTGTAKMVSQGTATPTCTGKATAGEAKLTNNKKKSCAKSCSAKKSGEKVKLSMVETAKTEEGSEK